MKPRTLVSGDTISVVVPAGPVNRERIDRALDRLRQRGFRTKMYGDIYRCSEYLAGDDATRAAELMTAFADPETTGVWCARGGYGVVRLLDRLDFDVVRRNPKVFIGFSDISALHIAIQQRAGLATFHGPNLQDGFGKADDMSAANQAALWHAVMADQQSSGDAGYTIDYADCVPNNVRCVAPGVAQGRLIGGNLAVTCGLIGTSFDFETAGRILFLEDISEKVYRIDRYLAQLKLAGKLQATAGILLGTFNYEDDEQAESQAAIAALLDEYCGNLGIPVLAGFPAGHAQYNLTLPMGALVELDADNLQVKILESTVLY